LNLYLIEKLSKNLMRGGNNYKVRKYIYNAFKNIKILIRIHPLILYFYIVYFFLITIEFKKVKKSGQYYQVPKSIMEEEIFLLRTVKLFSDVLKSK
jgi:ribosomal protein S7